MKKVEFILNKDEDNYLLIDLIKFLIVKSINWWFQMQHTLVSKEELSNLKF
jgi:hypothetical protein